MNLSDLAMGEIATVHHISHPDSAKAIALMSLGFDPGEPVKVMVRAPFGDPMQVKVGDTLVSIHSADARHINLCHADCTGHVE